MRVDLGRDRGGRRRGAKLAAAVVVLCASCTSTSQVRLEKGLSFDAFRNLGPIDRAHATLAVVIPEELRVATVDRKLSSVQYHIDVGDTLASKLMQLLAYKFDRVVLLEDEKAEPPIPWDLLMRVELKEIDLSLEREIGWNTYTMLSSGFIGLEAKIVNRERQLVWAGSSKAEGKGEAAGGAYEVPDIQGGLSQAIDIAIADIAHQLGRSEALKAAIGEVGAP